MLLQTKSRQIKPQELHIMTMCVCVQILKFVLSYLLLKLYKDAGFYGNGIIIIKLFVVPKRFFCRLLKSYFMINKVS